MRGLDEWITGNWGEDQFRSSEWGRKGFCAKCHTAKECTLIDDPAPEIEGDTCWICDDCHAVFKKRWREHVKRVQARLMGEEK